MKLFYSFFFALFTGAVLLAQAPAGINYQAAIRNLDGILLSNQAVGIKIDLL